MTQKNISCSYAQLSDGTSALELPAVRFRVIEGGAGRSPRCSASGSCEPSPKGIPAIDFRKIISFAIVCVVLLCCISAMTDAVAAANRDAQLAAADTSVVYVRPGDSLWTIAADHPVDGCSTSDVVDFIASSNGLEGGYLSPGQALVVPA